MLQQLDEWLSTDLGDKHKRLRNIFILSFIMAGYKRDLPEPVRFKPLLGCWYD